MDEDLVCDLDVAQVEQVLAAALDLLEAAGVRNREVATDWRVPVVVVPDSVVVAAAAVQVPLHRVPLVCYVAVDAISKERRDSWGVGIAQR